MQTYTRRGRRLLRKSQEHFLRVSFLHIGLCCLHECSEVFALVDLFDLRLN